MTSLWLLDNIWPTLTISVSIKTLTRGSLLLSPELGFHSHTLLQPLVARLTAKARLCEVLVLFRRARWLPWFVLAHSGMDGAAMRSLVHRESRHWRWWLTVARGVDGGSRENVNGGRHYSCVMDAGGWRWQICGCWTLLHQQTLKYPKIIYATKNHFLRHFYHTCSNSLIIRIIN